MKTRAISARRSVPLQSRQPEVAVQATATSTATSTTVNVQVILTPPPSPAKSVKRNAHAMMSSTVAIAVKLNLTDTPTEKPVTQKLTRKSKYKAKPKPQIIDSGDEGFNRMQQVSNNKKPKSKVSDPERLISTTEIPVRLAQPAECPPLPLVLDGVNWQAFFAQKNSRAQQHTAVTSETTALEAAIAAAVAVPAYPQPEAMPYAHTASIQPTDSAEPFVQPAIRF